MKESGLPCGWPPCSFHWGNLGFPFPYLRRVIHQSINKFYLYILYIYFLLGIKEQGVKNEGRSHPMRKERLNITHLIWRIILAYQRSKKSYIKSLIRCLSFLTKMTQTHYDLREISWLGLKLLLCKVQETFVIKVTIISTWLWLEKNNHGPGFPIIRQHPASKRLTVSYSDLVFLSVFIAGRWCMWEWKINYNAPMHCSEGTCYAVLPQRCVFNTFWTTLALCSPNY